MNFRIQEENIEDLLTFCHIKLVLSKGLIQDSGFCNFGFIQENLKVYCISLHTYIDCKP